jgi:hypothetical protein
MDLTIDPEFIIRPHQGSDESLIWTGKPRQGILFRLSDVFLIPFSVLWCGFAFFWFFGALKSGAPLAFALFGIPFILVGLFFVFGRFWLDARNRARTFYGITDSRVIIVSGAFSRSVKSLNIKTLSEVSIYEKRDGSGSITLGSALPYAAWLQSMNWPGTRPSPTLEFIPNVRDVYNTIVRIQRG